MQSTSFAEFDSETFVANALDNLEDVEDLTTKTSRSCFKLESEPEHCNYFCNSEQSPAIH